MPKFIDEVREALANYSDIVAKHTAVTAAESAISPHYFNIDLVGNDLALGPANSVILRSIDLANNTETNSGLAQTAAAQAQYLYEQMVTYNPPIGPQGIAGPQGATGATGPQGLQGTRGDQGLTGPQGVQGIQGVQGPKGADGSSFTVSATGTLAGRAVYDTALIPFSYLDTSAGNLYIKNSDTAGDWSAGIVFGKGDTGLPGPEGIQGPQGPAGPQGLQGLQGVTGNQGAAGPTGNMGPTGPQGLTGPTGPAGIQGPTGTQGVRGSRGYYIPVAVVVWSDVTADSAPAGGKIAQDEVTQFNSAALWSETRYWNGAGWVLIHRIVDGVIDYAAGVDTLEFLAVGAKAADSALLNGKTVINSVASTDISAPASAAAVKSAYDLAATKLNSGAKAADSALLNGKTVINSVASTDIAAPASAAAVKSAYDLAATKLNSGAKAADSALLNGKTVINSVASTDISAPASAAAVKSAYDLANSKLSPASAQALHVNDALVLSGSTLYLVKGNGASESVVLPTFGVGIAQSWQNLTATRALNTTYTNTTGKPIMVTVRSGNSNAGGGFTVTVNGVVIITSTSAYDGLQGSFVVPNGHTYKVTSAIAIQSWSELR